MSAYISVSWGENIVISGLSRFALPSDYKSPVITFFVSGFFLNLSENLRLLFLFKNLYSTTTSRFQICLRSWPPLHQPLEDVIWISGQQQCSHFDAIKSLVTHSADYNMSYRSALNFSARDVTESHVSLHVILFDVIAVWEIFSCQTTQSPLRLSLLSCVMT